MVSLEVKGLTGDGNSLVLITTADNKMKVLPKVMRDNIADDVWQFDREKYGLVWSLKFTLARTQSQLKATAVDKGLKEKGMLMQAENRPNSTSLPINDPVTSSRTAHI